MNDYLWDKTGAPDADAERLEELLEQFRFQPRALAVPATLPVTAPRPAQARDSFPYQRLAVAAALLLALLVSAGLVMLRQRAGDAPQLAHKDAAPREDATPRRTPQQAQQRSSAKASGGDSQSAREERRRHENGATLAQRRPDGPLRRGALAMQKRPTARPRQLDGSQELASATAQEREAMEKFLLALKVTSEKLGYAERQVQSLDESSSRR